MVNPFEEPFSKPKPRRPGIAPLVGDVFGPGAQRALEKVTGKEKKKPMAPPEDLEGGDITMSAVEREKMQIEREHVRLHNIPTFKTLPSEDILKKDFTFDWIWSPEYQENRPMTDYALTDTDLVSIGVNEQAHARIMEAMSRAKETLPIAKVFDIGDIIKQKQQADPEHPDTLSTKEVFEAIDAAGYRPATLQELFAYGRDHWKPDVDPNDLSNEDAKRLHHANAPYIYALGAPFSDSGGFRSVPFLSWRGSGRRLNALGLVDEWDSGNRFLVFRKGSS